ncbi:MAG: 2-amino-4-hydroxy-6-hydroxymethyldihydropteridine diphosphokinase [Pseudomonadota bacterium]
MPQPVTNPPDILIALGSNLPNGDQTAADMVARAIAQLGDRGADVAAQSAFYQTPAFPEGSGPDFVNAAVRVHWDGTPDQVLTHLHAVEAQLGRVRTVRWGPRAIDLDLIAVGQRLAPDLATFQTWRDLPLAEQAQRTPERLILPHPRLADRAFVLVPLADVAPDWVHPVSGRTVQQMCDALPAAQIAEVRRLE